MSPQCSTKRSTAEGSFAVFSVFSVMTEISEKNEALSRGASQDGPDANATHYVNQLFWSGGFLITAPRNVLVGADKHKLAVIERLGVGSIDIQNNERDSALGRCFGNAGAAHARIEADQRVVSSQRVVERTMSLKP